MAKRELLPDQFISKFRVGVRTPSGKTIRGDDSRPLEDWRDAPSLETEVTYIGTVVRLDGRLTLHMQWIDEDNNAHRVILPHEAVQAVLRSVRSVSRQSKSEGARKAAQTRKARGIVPFEPKDRSAE